MNSSAIALDCDQLLLTERDRFRTQAALDQDSSPQSQRTDRLCRECFFLVQYLRQGFEPSKLVDYEPCGQPQTQSTRDWKGVDVLTKCSLCIFWSDIKTPSPPDSPPVPRTAFKKITPEQARGNEVDLQSESLDDILFLYDQSYAGPTQAEHPVFSVTGNTVYAEQARIIPRTEVSLDLVREWLSRCNSEHGDLCKQTSNKEESPLLQIIVIDVEERCLVRTNSADQYVTLSYVRGPVSILELTRENMNELFQKDGLLRHERGIPAVVRDAMAFVRSLGQKYLWVDSLGIVQNDPVAKQEQINRMSTIYSSSMLTLVALSGADASCPLPGVQPNTRALDSFAIPWQPGIFVAKRTPDLHNATIKSTYTTRAWCFQERTLSRRCLYFLKDQVYFQCQRAIWSEDRRTDLAEDLHKLNPLTTFAEPASTEFVRTPHGLFQLYLLLVTEYMQKDLTNPSDIVNAFAGLVEKIQGMRSVQWRGQPVSAATEELESRGCAFVHGLPEPILDVALLWCGFSPDPQRRLLDHSFVTKDSLLEPSWSWSGWRSAVNYDITTMWGGKLRSCILEFAVVTRALSASAPGTNCRFIHRQFEDLQAEDVQLQAGFDFELDASERLVQQLLTRDRLEDMASANPLPHGYSSGLIFEASCLPMHAFLFTSERVIWKFTGIKAAPAPHGQLAIHLYSYSHLERSHKRLCGAIYGINATSLPELAGCYLVAMSELQRTPANPYVRAETGECWKECCSPTYVRNIYDPNFYERRDWCLLNVLLVAPVPNHEEWVERKGVGHIHIDAWNRWIESPSTTTIQLL